MSAAAPFPHQNTHDASTQPARNETDGAAPQDASTTDQTGNDRQTTGVWDSFLLTGPPVSADFMAERASKHPPTTAA